MDLSRALLSKTGISRGTPEEDALEGLVWAEQSTAVSSNEKIQKIRFIPASRSTMVSGLRARRTTKNSKLRRGGERCQTRADAGVESSESRRVLLSLLCALPEGHCRPMQSTSFFSAR